MKQLFRQACMLALVLTLSAAPIVAASSCCGSSSSSCCSSSSSSSCGSCCSTSGSNTSSTCSGCTDSSCSSCCGDSSCDDDVYCKSHFSPRSQGLDGSRLLAGNHHRMHLYDKDEVYGTFNVALVYQRSFNNEEQGRYVSPNCGSSCFTIGADSATDTNVRNHDFGIDCTGTVSLCPRIESFIADFHGFVGLNSWLEGLFFDIQLPLVHTWWKPFCCVSTTGDCADTFFDADGNELGCLMDEAGEDAATGTNSLEAALNGNYTWGDVKNKLCYGKICCNKESETRLADVRFRLGYDFLLEENHHFGLKLIVAAPTGNRAEARYLWEPIAGNGGHWEFGGGFTGHVMLWDKDDDKSFSLHSDLEVTTLIKSRCQKRLFDLADNGCFSRYLLLKKFADGDTDTIALDGLERGPNVFAQTVKIKANVQVDATILFNFKYNNWMFDIGYNGWYRSEEKISDFCPCIPENTYGIKGNNGMCNDPSLDSPEGDYNTASAATIAKATDADGANLVDDATNGDPTFIATDCSIFNQCSALHPSAVSHAVFGHIAYSWEDNDWAPTVGIGAKGEFSGKGNRAVDQWSIWFKGGVSF